jgi:vancomycin resistance protein VanJ
MSASLSDSATKHWAKASIGILCILYLAVLIGLICYIRLWGDRSPLGTIVLFSPRWLFALPLALLFPLAGWLDRKLLILPGIAAMVVLFGLLGFSIGWRRWLPSSPAVAPAIRVLTFNTHFDTLRIPALADYIQQMQPDVVTLEEWNAGPLSAVLKTGGWHCVQCGENILASRFVLDEASLRQYDAFFHCNVLLPSGPIDVAVLHLSSPHTALRDAMEDYSNASPEIQENISWRSEQAAAIHRFMQKQKLPLVLAGDFNLVPDSIIFRENFADLTDAFEAGGFGFGYTFFNRWTRVRIDHVLMDNSFRCKDCFVGPFLGSPHRPVIADLVPLRGR